MDDYNPDDFDWLQAAIECAEYTYILNEDRYKELDEKDRIANLPGLRIRAARYRKAHPDAVRARGSRRRKKEPNSDNFTENDVVVQMKSQKGKCWWCGIKVKIDDYHVDHVIPLARGGSNRPENIVISCSVCNLKKGSKTAQEFAGRLF